MNKSTKLWIVIFILLTGTGKAIAQIPSTRIYDGEKLAKVKVRMESKEYAAAITKLMNDADKALKSKPVSVMDKTMVAGSGDKHDYVSMGPYWWPDPTKPDGLPYIRKDGVRNPNATSDCTNIGKTINDVSTLGIAYYFSGNEKYAAKAAELIRVWFLNPETRMNPNMNYAQMIPGHNENKGRGFGMIDVYPFINLLDAVELMNTSTAFTAADRNSLKGWFTEYLEWIRTSPVADEARTSEIIMGYLSTYNKRYMHSSPGIPFWLGRQSVSLPSYGCFHKSNPTAGSPGSWNAPTDLVTQTIIWLLSWICAQSVIH